jgi:ABC-2 type transport system ATP-binding protein
MNPTKTIIVELADDTLDHQRLAVYGEIIETENSRISLRVPKNDTARITAQILAELPVTDVGIEDPPIEDAIEQIFATPDDSKVMKAIVGD